MSGSLVVVATPIGNLGDLSARAIEVLTSAQWIYCEDTRHSRQLLSANKIKAGGRLRALHEHNEASMSAELIEHVASGAVVALVSDAGTPGISDPGARVISAVARAGLLVTTTPGPSAVIGALSVSGLAMDRFVMEGFLPRKIGERDAVVATWLREQRTIVFYESPQRLATTLQALAKLMGERRGAVVRELTKLHEEVVRGTVAELNQEFQRRDARGEIVMVLEGASELAPVDDETVRRALEDEFANERSVRDASARVASALGAPHRRVYELALALRRGDNDSVSTL